VRRARVGWWNQALPRVAWWYRSRWLEDQAVERKAIGPIRVSGSFGKRTFVVSRRNAPPWTITPTWTRTSINDLQGRGYVLDLQDYRG
jgi:hypothetical protein